MKRNWIGLVLIIVFGSHVAWGQATSPALLNGILMFEKGDYYESIHLLAKVIGQKETAAADLPKAHFFLGQAYLGMIRSNPKFRKKNPFAVSRAYTHLQTAHQLDHGGRYTDLAAMALEIIQPYLYNEGVYHFNKNAHQSSDYYFKKALSINSKDYEAMMGHSFVAMAMSDTTAAIATWEKMALIHQQDGGDSVPSAVAKGYELLSTYRKEESNTEVSANNKTIFPKAIALQNSELTVYRDQALSQRESVRLFEDILSKYPEDTKSTLAYAELLQSMGRKDTAMILYEQVLKKDPTQLLAHKNLAVYHFNQAADLAEALPNLKGEKRKAKQLASINKWLAEAWPHFKILHQAEPNEKMWLEQLVLIAQRLDKPEADVYAKKLDKESWKKK